jgi:hypothetical protein
LRDSDPESALSNIRKATEALAKDLYRRLGYEQNGRPARTLTLEYLLKPVQNSNVPEVFKLIVRLLQNFWNFASHDQDDESKHLTKAIVGPLIALYDQALLNYSTWLKVNE